MRTSWYRWRGDGLELRLYVQPGARRSKVMGVYGDSLKVRIAAPPVDGKANHLLCCYLAEEFGVARAQVELLSGAGSREKRVVIRSPRHTPRWLDRSS